MRLLLNPPGKMRYLRDYYCAGIAKTNYYYPPIDLVYLSATGQDIFWADLINQPNKKIPYESITEVISLISLHSIKEDLNYLAELKEKTRAKIIVTGDVVRAYPKQFLENYNFIDDVITDFNDRLKEENIEYQHLPKFEAIGLKDYFYPFYKTFPVAHLLSDYGCAYKCDFCPISSVKLDFFPIDFFERQLQALQKLGISEIHLRDQTFGLKKSHFIKTCELLKQYKMNWSCFTRLDLMKPDALQIAQDSGCHFMIFGIESSNEQIRENHEKALNSQVIWETLKNCKNLGIRTIGTFILGLPEESQENMQATINYAKSLPLDYASFNRAQYRLNTKMTEKARIYQFETLGEVPSNVSSLSTVEQMVSKANRSFYLRPSKIGLLAKDMLRRDSLLNYIKSIPVLFGKSDF
jgi:anaerobic magnesium-protoporphyrin IX monomethyl ester cyclase